MPTTNPSLGHCHLSHGQLAKQFFIVNEFDKPSEQNIAQISNGLLFYVEPRLNKLRMDGMLTTESTPLEDFGLELSLENGWLQGIAIRQSEATYRDGKPRRWQGSSNFRILLDKVAANRLLARLEVFKTASTIDPIFLTDEAGNLCDEHRLPTAKSFSGKPKCSKEELDGGPAFPRAGIFSNWNATVKDGMSLRDWFAGMALSGRADNLQDPCRRREILAKYCYEIADAMIAERNRKEEA